MRIAHLLISSAAALLTASSAFASFDITTELKEREVTRQLNQQEAAEAREKNDARRASSPVSEPSLASQPSPTVGSALTSETSADSTISMGVEDDALSEETKTDTFATADGEPTDVVAGNDMSMASDDDVGSATSSLDNDSDDYAPADGAASSRTEPGFMSDASGNVTPQATGDTNTQDLSPTSTEATVDLDEVEEPQETLAASKVETSSGQTIGEVQTVVIGANGRPMSVVIEADSLLGADEDPIQLPADAFVYLPDKDILVTDMSSDELRSMAQAE